MPVLIIGISLVFIGLILLKVFFLKRRIIWALLFFALFLSGAAVSYLGYSLFGYRIFYGNEPLALIESRPVKGEIYDMALKLKWIKIKNKGHARLTEFGPEEKFLLAGNQWALDGSMIKLKPVFNFSAIKILRVENIKSRYFNPYSQAQSPQIAYSICAAKGGLIDFIAKHKWPFIEAFILGSAYMLPDEKAKFYLYASDSGFVVKKAD